MYHIKTILSPQSSVQSPSKVDDSLLTVLRHGRSRSLANLLCRSLRSVGYIDILYHTVYSISQARTYEIMCMISYA